MLLVVVLCFLCSSTGVFAQEWWKTAIFYQIYPRSFMDSDNTGVGDIKGITSKVEYLANLGVNAVWLSPIYKSPMADFGYDISNFTDVDSLFGTMTDLQDLIKALKDRNIKIIMDFVPNHTSDEHPWFTASVNEESNYSDFYIWRDSAGTNDSDPQVPNNWQSVFSGSAWEWNAVRQQYYLHQFVIKQPDLNYRNPLVVQAMKDVVQFWLDQGVDGFRVDAIEHLVEDEQFLNEPLLDSTSALSYDNLNHVYVLNQNLTFDIVAGWAQLVADQIAKDGNDRIMFMEVYNTIATDMRYYGRTNNTMFQMPFNFHLLSAINEGMTAADFLTNFNDWLDNMPTGYTANWVVGNHDNHRVASRAGVEMVDSINMILAMLPGIMITYNGDELGMSNTYLRFDETVDPSGTLLGPDGYTSGSRDPERTPFQWDDTENAGFSSNTTKTWLPVNPNYWQLNAAAQSATDRSHLNVYKSLAKMRQSTTFISNTTAHQITAPTTNTLIIRRSSNDGDTFVLIVNLDSIEVTTVYSLTNVTQMYVYVASINSDYSTGDAVTLSAGVTLRPKAAVILTTSTPTSSTSSSSSISLPVAILYALMLSVIRLNF